jgi:hypothetical protein
MGIKTHVKVELTPIQHRTLMQMLDYSTQDCYEIDRMPLPHIDSFMKAVFRGFSGPDEHYPVKEDTEIEMTAEQYETMIYLLDNCDMEYAYVYEYFNQDNARDLLVRLKKQEEDENSR